MDSRLVLCGHKSRWAEFVTRPTQTHTVPLVRVVSFCPSEYIPLIPSLMPRYLHVTLFQSLVIYTVTRPRAFPRCRLSSTTRSSRTGTPWPYQDAGIVKTVLFRPCHRLGSLLRHVKYCEGLSHVFQLAKAIFPLAMRYYIWKNFPLPWLRLSGNSVRFHLSCRQLAKTWISCAPKIEVTVTW